jgi:two-component system NtrC family sensor kinase
MHSWRCGALDGADSEGTTRLNALASRSGEASSSPGQPPPGAGVEPVPPRGRRLARAFRPLSVAAILLPALMFCGGAWWAWAQVQSEAAARLVRTVQMLKEHALRAFEAQETAISAVERAIRDLSWEEIATSREIHDTLRALEQATRVMSGLGLVTPEGRMVSVATQFPFTPVNVSDREYFRANRPPEGGAVIPSRGSLVGEVVVSRPRNVPVFSLSRPRRDALGRFDGVIVTAVAPEYFADFYAQVAESTRDVATLFRLDGALLARSLPVQDWSARMTAGEVVEAAGSALAPRTLVARSTLDGIERFYAVQRLENYPVAVSYGLDRRVMEEAWLRRIAVLGLVSALTSLLLLALTARAAGAARRERYEAERRAEAEAARADAEAALRGAQRMEALGQLAAGVAHDFRNTVQAVQSGAHLARRALKEGDAARAERMVAMMSDAAARGAALTQRMLAMARQRPTVELGAEMQPVSDPAEVLREAAELLRPAFGAPVALRCDIEEGLPHVIGDRAEFEAAVVNLAVNARDAMPAGGVIRIAAVLAGVGDGPGEATGPRVRISVEDSGSGMDAETLAKATDAFFTTKPPGKGTGLGLASARAFAEGAGGALHIDSAVGRGTTVSLWLPVAPSHRAAERSATGEPMAG